MKVVAFRTYRSFFCLNVMIPLTVSGILGIWIMQSLALATYNTHVYDITILGDLLRGVFKTTVFIWTSGLFMLYITAAAGTSAIAGEETNDTLGLLVSAPIRRSSILSGKFIGLTLAVWIYTNAFLVLSMCATILTVHPRIESFLILMPYLPPMALYSLLMIFIALSLFFCMSVFLKRIPALILSILIITAIFLVIPTIRPIAQIPVYLDLQHQAAATYDHMTEKANTSEIKMISQDMFSRYTQTYMDIKSAYDPDYSLHRPYLDRAAGSMPEYTAVLTMLAVFALNAMSLYGFSRKDV